MRDFTNDERILVAGHLAALRAQGWPAGRALSMVASRLPASDAKATLARVAAGLERGEAIATEGEEPLVALLARGEAAGADALDEATRGYVLAAEAQEAGRRIRAMLLIGAGGLVMTAVTLAIVAPTFLRFYADFGSALPAPTAFLLGGWVPITTLLVLAAIGVGMIAGRPPPVLRRLAGADALESASRLRVFAAAVQAGIPESEALAWLDEARPARLDEVSSLAFDPLEKHLLRVTLEREGPAPAARLLAESRAQEGSGPSRLFTTFGPVAAFLAFSFVIGLLLIAAYMPIFSIAGAVQ